MRIVYTQHAEAKLKTKEAKKLKITKTVINKVAKIPLIQQYLGRSMVRLVSEFGKTHSICVIIKLEKKAFKVITFFPAERGRYEGKILSKR